MLIPKKYSQPPMAVSVKESVGSNEPVPLNLRLDKADSLAAASKANPLLAQPFSASNRATPPAPNSWADNGDLWPGRSAIQEVTPGVCITNFFGAKKRTQLDEQGITHVLICANELPEAFPNSFQYLKLNGFTDNTGTDLIKQLDVAIPWIDQALKRGGRVLLHCATGSSRSGAVMVAYLMRHRHLPMQEALELAKSIRPIIKPNPGFLEQLENLSYRQG